MDIPDISSLRNALLFLSERSELITTNKEVDPFLEVIGIAKALEDGPGVLFENVRGYPGHRTLINIFGRKSRACKLFRAEDPKRLKFRFLDAIKNPIPPMLVKSAPCQEVIIKDNIDVLKTIPVTQSIETDPGRIICGGISLISHPDVGTCIANRRTLFRGPDWASMNFYPGGHVASLLAKLRAAGGKLPLTLNIGCPPAVMAVGATGSLHMVIPTGADELAIAGGLQGAAVETCRALTVDAYAIAKAEWVIEGYLEASDPVWESDEAERTGNPWLPFLIEWRGYQGWARRVPRFRATAITHRRDRPIFYATVASGMEAFTAAAAFTEAAFYDIGNRVRAGLVQDVNVTDGMHGYAGAIIQVRKRSKQDDEFVRNALMTCLGSTSLIQMIIVVDEDVNIYELEDVMWALTTRVDPNDGIMGFGMKQTGVGAVSERKDVPTLARAGRLGKIGFDATVPFDSKFLYERKQHPSVDLTKWFDARDVARIREQQSAYAQFISESRF